MPDNATPDDIRYHREVAELIAERSALLDEALRDGLDAALASGKLVSHEQVKKAIEQWFAK